MSGISAITSSAVQQIFFLPDIETDDRVVKHEPVAGVTIITKEQAKEYSSLGTPILSPVRFKAGSYFRWSQGELVSESMDELRLPVTTMISPVQNKMIVVTDLQGGLGSVKEITGMKDWELSFDGVIIKERDHPQGYSKENDMMQIMSMWNQLADSIEVGCPLLSALGIRKITITGMDFKPVRGSENIAFSFKALSDDIDEIIEGLI